MRRTTVLRTLAVIIVVGVVLMFLVACDDVRSGNKNVGDCGTDDAGNNCVTTITYKGKPLHCVTWNGGHTEVGMSCDFVEYHLNDLRQTETPEGF